MIETRRPAFLDGQPKGLLIDGQMVAALSGETFQSVSASTGELVADLALASAQDVDRAVRAARAAFDGPWSRFKPAERQAVLLRLAELVDAEFEDLALLDCIEMGRPITAARGLRDSTCRYRNVSRSWSLLPPSSTAFSASFRAAST